MRVWAKMYDYAHLLLHEATIRRTTPQLDDRSDHNGRFAELQHRWHGGGSPVGVGVALLSLGGFIVLLTIAWSLVT